MIPRQGVGSMSVLSNQSKIFCRPRDYQMTRRGTMAIEKPAWRWPSSHARAERGLPATQPMGTHGKCSGRIPT